MAHDVFVSYSSKDKTIADTIVAAMENNHIRCWYAPRDIQSSEDWGEAITSAIEQCKVFLLIFSGNANQSQRVLDELNLAIFQQAIIFPFRVENLEPHGAMRLHLSSRHWLDAYDPSWQSHIKKLIMDVSANLETSIDEQQIVVPESIEKKYKQQSNKLTRILAGIVVGAFLITAGWLGLSSLNKQGHVIPVPAETYTSTPQESLVVHEPEITENPTPTPESLPYGLKGFSETILAAVNDRPPDFEDDFSQVKPGWQQELYDPDSDSWGCLNTNTEDIQMVITDGTMKLPVKDGCIITFASHPDMEYANFFLQVDVDFSEIDFSITVGWNIENDDSGVFYNEFQINKTNWTLNTARGGNNWIEQKSGEVSVDDSKPFTLTLIQKDKVSVIFLDAVPLTYYYDETDVMGIFSVHFMVVGDGNNIFTQTLELDNIKVWDLDKIEQLPIMATNPENGHRYLYVEENKTWHQARQYCQSLGGYLVAIETPSENSFVYQLTGGVAWLGATDEDKEGFFVWANGQLFDYQNFAGGEPNIHGRSYISFYDDMDTGELLETWKDVPGDIEMPFVCEWEPVGQE